MAPKKHEQVIYDEENDVLYVLLSDNEVVRTKALDDLRLVDYDIQEEPVGIEFIGASDGIDLAETPRRARIQLLLEEAEVDFPIHA